MLFSLLEHAKDEVRDDREAAAREKEQLLETICGLNRKLKHVVQLLDAYIPEVRRTRTHLQRPSHLHTVYSNVRIT